MHRYGQTTSGARERHFGLSSKTQTEHTSTNLFLGFKLFRKQCSGFPSLDYSGFIQVHKEMFLKDHKKVRVGEESAERKAWGRGIFFFLMTDEQEGWETLEPSRPCHISGPIVQPKVVWLNIRTWGCFSESSFIA